MRQGVIPCAPYSPELLISVRTMEVFHNAHLRCPRLSLQAFLCILCDLNSIAYEPYMHQQFMICYDLYVAILKRVEHHINQALCHDAVDYRLWNACAACTLSLRDEPGTPIHPHYCMDGNNSLKRLQRRDDENQESSQERMDNHEVNAWLKEAIGNMIVTDAKDTEGNPCADQWENMKNDMNSSMWGVFDETGVFVSLCRHDLMCGYDVGCKFGMTIAKSPLGVLATEQNHTTVVGAFHGHAHCRICQICKLPLYTDGQGLTDHEECERYFSESNALASSTCYASRFHRMQAIVQWMKHKDRALSIMATIPALQDTMIKLNIPSSKCFPQWLAEELAYLKNRKQDPPEETLEMEYYSRLVAYYHIEYIETARRQLLERQDKALDCVQDMKCVMNITTRALVSRLFELTKMNRLGTGYKACRHIGKALKARSHTIRGLVDCYNAAAKALEPPRPMLKWEDVVEYTFLSEFDLLKDTREDICEKPWANSAVREASDAYYQIIRAQEEVHRLNIEIHRFVTKIKAEEKYLRRAVDELKVNDPSLSYQVKKYRLE
ncbi:hypothetical protein ARMGADRAFT_1048995 [Armillaria gallica]|uniref:CxC2-like cysteine cluster KDZ transposase-associated domain-containing protein n=1 Tax=Armillaria gallica TaxID=47427 RepID=A0A2H3CPX1_ARMGA|nr:hypothetical protein ARMGADRAFT_1048995 [Armillaria gallica]